MSKVPILTYHSIDSSGSVISTSPGKFESQMRYLAESSFKVISLNDVVKCIQERRPFPPKAAVITFDDGFKNIYDEAYPVLRKFGFKATVFLVPGYCGRNNRWNGQPEGIPTLDLLSWDEIGEMVHNGVEFGAHTMSHPDLSRCSLAQATQEIAHSKSMIQRHIGRDVLFFAYPYGKLTGDIKRVVKDQFYGSCSTKLGFTTLESDIYSLPRIDMYYFSKNNLFLWLETPFSPIYVNFRKILRLIKLFQLV